ncbi:hypothetical protein AAFN86_08755 [Roseomonas sp. CAU 1739]
MKAILSGVVVAIVIAIGAAYVLDTKVQETVQVAFTTSGARI